MDTNSFSSYTEHRTGAEIDRLLHHGHWIPVTKGFTQRYVDEHFPGWSWNDLMAIWRAAGIVVRPAGGAPLQCDERVAAMHFSGPGNWLIEWRDGAVTTSGG